MPTRLQPKLKTDKPRRSGDYQHQSSHASIHSNFSEIETLSMTQVLNDISFRIVVIPSVPPRIFFFRAGYIEE
jgi:hypothetical protein